MDPVLLARLQFASTTIYHFFFVPLTLGLVWVVAGLHTMYYRTGDEKWKRMTKFWGKLFLINFAMGVVTGIVQEFQFGMNWSEYSRYVGDIFGAPLAIEALLAFFMESTFLGIWIFGWDRVPRGLHLASIWLVVIGSNLSALWILIANSFMQNPVGYDPASVEAGRLVLNNFAELIFNRKAWLAFPHTILAGLTTAAFFMFGISAYHLARKQNVEIFKKSFQIAAVLGLVAVTLTGLVGHSQGVEVMESQPMKMASIEAIWENDPDEPGSPFSLITIGDLTGRQEVWSWRVPRLLSLISCNNLDCEVPGVNQIQAEYEATYGPGNYIPLMVFTYWGFRFMFFSSLIMVGLGGLGVLAVMRNRVEKMKFLTWFPLAIVLPYFANTGGWIVTEMGRQPWIVQGLLQTQEAVSPNVSAGMVLFSLIGFVAIYAALMVADVYLLTRFAKAGPDATDRGVIGEGLEKE
ncbi:MAG: cytochrome ubiquinol oxidase subunit I [Anaerolineales bacterium]|nr:cytochrome ubiquinol oxidase subunit I [Anaerolineales bacterium]